MIKKVAALASVIVKQDDPPTLPEVMEKAILDIAKGMRALNDSRLRKSALIILLHARTHVARRDIEYVLNALDQLEQTYLKPAKGA